jgi:anti-sigma factor (TIGR02949 family)
VNDRPETDCGSGCAEALERLEAYLDGELPESDAPRIAEHLRECYPCTDRLSFEEHLREIVRRDCAEQAPPHLLARIQAQLSADTAG